MAMNARNRLCEHCGPVKEAHDSEQFSATIIATKIGAASAALIGTSVPLS
jgi:hypothetical protein